MSIHVKFRIVGIYFGSVPGKPPDKNTTGDVEVEVEDDPRVIDILEKVQNEVRQNPGSFPGVTDFRYNLAEVNGKHVLDRVAVDYDQTPKPNRGYAHGTYSLQQEPHGDPMRVFQYYIYSVKDRGEGESDALLRKNTDNAFVPLDQDPENEIEDGDYVVWRLLTIRTKPDYIPIYPLDPEDLDGLDKAELQELFAARSSSPSPLSRKLIEAVDNITDEEG